VIVLAWVRVLIGGVIFGLTIDVAIRALVRRLRPRRPGYGALPWDPAAVIRTGPLTDQEAAIARRLEAHLTRTSTVNGV
jgi:hypothetical protein